MTQIKAETSKSILQGCEFRHQRAVYNFPSCRFVAISETGLFVWPVLGNGKGVLASVRGSPILARMLALAPMAGHGPAPHHWMLSVTTLDCRPSTLSCRGTAPLPANAKGTCTLIWSRPGNWLCAPAKRTGAGCPFMVARTAAALLAWRNPVPKSDTINWSVAAPTLMGIGVHPDAEHWKTVTGVTVPFAE